MSGSLPVTFSPHARRTLREAAYWWAANRSKAPDAFAEELDRALSLIAAQPHLGARARSSKYPGLRRIHLARIRYYLYYRVTDDESPVIEVLALWHSSRGQKPEVKEPRVAYA